MIGQQPRFISEGRQRLSARRWLALDPVSINQDRAIVYDLLAMTIPDTPSTEEMKLQANVYYDRLRLRGYKQDAKKDYWARLFQAGKRALHRRACVRYSRKKGHQIESQVIDAAVNAGFFTSYRSPPGAPKMSRLVPTKLLARCTENDPWQFDPEQEDRFVFLRDRKTKEEINFDPTEAIPTRYQQRLEQINAVNARFKITYEPYDEWEDRFCSPVRLRPVHRAIFTDDFRHHGRLYTGRYGHQSLRKIERQTIKFNGEPCVELDYAGMHPKMLYHLAGLDFQGDPYRLWPDTTPAQRHLVKIMLHAAINAKSRTAAISACNSMMSPRTKDGTAAS